MDKHAMLRSITFGQPAEEETDVLSTHFVETNHWQRLYRADIDVVYKPKGFGKERPLLLASVEEHRTLR
jgi:hypothetical protein